MPLAARRAPLADSAALSLDSRVVSISIDDTLRVGAR
jgi:hypothetical protein